ncbi:MFS transporter [Propionivibrio dicarboxylicus]|uniref:Metabolite-proton symporter n=1 Tax=Propionivibrio dicarboxylicus TaxID=83767 RepID=A0A1G8AC19_9RHOO|nr:MFS transporter [Propionivibrio dicarboxylicus]SDH18386.1 metabolite-proton symporter [Propionivibrio dicarboxylicus]
MVSINSEQKKALAASLFGAAIEWFDFFLYGTAAALVFGKLFFPNSDPAVGLLLSYVTFSIPFFIRPFGGVVFAHIGDKLGRRKSLILTLSLMGGATVLIGCLPTYAQWGFYAPAALMTLRAIQGLGIGGEWGGALLMAVENSNKTTKSLFGSVPQMGVPLGMLFGTAALNFVGNHVTEAEFLEWGWRLPFISSAVLVAIGLWLRFRINETPEFEEAKKKGKQVKIPLVETLHHHWREVLLAIGLKVVETAPFYILSTFVITYVTKSLELPRNVVLTAITWATIACIIMIPLMGLIADRVGRRRMYGWGAFIMMLYAFPYFALLNTKDPALISVATVVGLGIIWTPITAVLGTLSAEIFDAEVRYTGVTLGYQAGAALAGGTAPLIATWLMLQYGGSYVPIAIYFMVTCAISLFAISCVRRHRSQVGHS